MKTLATIVCDGSQEFVFLRSLRERAGATATEVEKTVKEILSDVKKRGDSAVIEYSKRFDNAESIRKLTKSDFKKAFDAAERNLQVSLINAAARLSCFHKNQVRKGFTAEKYGMTGQLVRGLSRVGLYVPGGTASYPSSVLMCCIPAKLAGVSKVVIVSPPAKNGQLNNDILAAAYVSGADEMFLVGGAQAIAALAYGTETIKKVDKIVGPGNIYVATAKRLVYGQCDIDMVAGPSEITIIADESAPAKYVAADLISQAEHDELASSILLTTSNELVSKTKAELARQLALLPRAETAKKALLTYGGIILCESTEKMVALANEIAPEHLEIITKQPETLLPLVENAGSVFLGKYSPEPLGDYLAGTNHVLPTGGSARFFSPLSVDSFTKTMQYVNYTEKELKDAAKDVITLARREGLDGHAKAIEVRLK